MSTGISWTDETWTVVTGCSKVSAGCQHCYAETLAKRLSAMGKAGYTDRPWTARNAADNVTLRPERLDQPLRWKKPRRVFVTSMGDLFHEQVPDEFIDEVFAVMALARHHTFQVLTKRPERMAAYLNERWQPDVFRRRAGLEGETRRDRVLDKAIDLADPGRDSDWTAAGELRARYQPWPLPNVWLGTSVEDQRAADTRIPHLLRTPAAVRFLSCEPLIGPVDLRGLRARNGALIDALAGDARTPDGVIYAAAPGSIHWVIAGGESGPNHRPLEHAWMRSLRDQCEAAGVAFWAKQDAGARSEIELPDDLRIREMPAVAS